MQRSALTPRNVALRRCAEGFIDFASKVKLATEDYDPEIAESRRFDDSRGFGEAPSRTEWSVVCLEL